MSLLLRPKFAALAHFTGIYPQRLRDAGPQLFGLDDERGERTYLGNARPVGHAAQCVFPPASSAQFKRHGGKLLGQERVRMDDLLAHEREGVVYSKPGSDADQPSVTRTGQTFESFAPPRARLGGDEEVW